MSTFRSVRLSTFEKPKFGQLNNAPAGADVKPSQDTVVEPLGKIQSVPRPNLISTDSYRVNMLPGRPVFLEHQESVGASAQIDPTTGFALLNTSTSSFVWSYVSSESVPFSLEFGQNVPESTTGVLIPPFGAATEPGFVLVNNETGSIIMWESVGRSVADGLFSQGNSIEGFIRLHGNETIECAVYIDQVGLICTSSAGRFYLVTLRDGLGKPQISVSRMRSFRGGLLAIKDTLITRSYHREIVSIVAGAQINESERAVYICNKYGQMSTWQCSSQGTAKLISETELVPLLYKGLCLLYSAADRSLRIQDIQVDGTKLYILSSFHHEGSVFWLVGFAEIENSSNVTTSSLHRLQSYVSTEQSPAKLIVGDKIVFACFSDAVVLLERSAEAHKARFEDALFVKPNVSIFGAGTSSAGLEVVTTAGILEIHLNDRLTLPTPQSRIQVAISQSSSILPLDLQPHTPLGSPAEINEAIVATVKNISSLESKGDAKSTLLLRAEWLRMLITVVDGAPLPEGTDVPVDPDTRWWLTEEMAILTAAEAITDKTMSSSHVKDVGNTPALLISLLSTAPALGFAGVLAAQNALRVVGTPEKFPKRCPWPANRELVSALERAASEIDPVVAEAVQAVCGAYKLRLGYLESQGDRQEYKNVVQSVKVKSGNLIMALSDVDFPAAMQIAESFAVVEPLARLVAKSWSPEPTPSQTAQLEEYISRFGYEFAEVLFTQLRDNNDIKTVFQMFLRSHPEYLARYVEEKQLYRQGWVLAFFQNDTERAANILRKAVDTPTSVQERRVIASLQKLCAIQAGDVDLKESANTVLEVSNAQLELQRQYKSAGDYLRTKHDGVNELLSHFLPKLKTTHLKTEDVIDLLTFVPMKTPGSEDNFARAFSLLSSPSQRANLLAQQTIIHTDWSQVNEETLRDSLLYKTLHSLSSEANKNHLIHPASWSAPTNAPEIKQLYPWATPSSLEKLHTDFTNFNATIEKICNEYDMMKWLHLCVQPEGESMEID
ncbi:hypothetical protein B9G98_01391 [Wickerhamiella sorbophila]|uniref:Nucleoporin Nup133/Nup155-like N-terminal domain-containing protein n=1 Tax=Wickerhamiella sorbophila TaxID=45607 RepID=A0A2T0FFJ9_9ASCO|nr:hypothetical protein B9G98_01391 [Wickerhamiella sorbophila]PRT53771.1 hypothetical protein B9G98_01391 [Wickerhamiella sorbophila]